MSDRKPRPQRPYRGPTAKPYGPPRKMTRDELKAAAEDAWKVLPPFDAGFTCAQIGEATGLSAAAVHKIIGTQRKRDLDSPVAPASPDNPETESRSE